MTLLVISVAIICSVVEHNEITNTHRHRRRHMSVTTTTTKT